MGSPVASPPRRPLPSASSVTPPRIAPWFPLVLSLLAAAALRFLVVAQYQRASAEQSGSGQVDYSGLSTPAPGPWSSLLEAGAFVALVVGPFVATLVGVWSATWVWLSWESLRSRDRAFLLLAAAVAAAVVAFLLSPTGRGTTRFLLD